MRKFEKVIAVIAIFMAMLLFQLSADAVSWQDLKDPNTGISLHTYVNEDAKISVSEVTTDKLPFVTKGYNIDIPNLKGDILGDATFKIPSSSRSIVAFYNILTGGFEYIKSNFDGENVVFEYTCTGKYYLSNPTFGDTNLDTCCNVKDVTLIQQYLSCQSQLSTYQTFVADANYDNALNILDATYIQKTISFS